MARRIAVSQLNASTIDILNTIRQNAPYEYQSTVPAVETADMIPKVGEVIYGTPAFANYFVNALVNRIALVRIQSATFNNIYSRLKKGYLEFGETVEEIFVNIAKVVTYDVEKAPQRELQRSLPDVRSAFHAINWRVMYPVTIQDTELKRAFLSIDGVRDLIAKIVDSVYKAAEYDEFLLFKYMLIKAASHGQMYPISIGAGTEASDAAVAFRGISNTLTFMKDAYTESGNMNNTPRNRQVIFMDAMYNAQFDVDVLAAAFNMDKANFMGSLFLIDDFTTFDNARFAEIRAENNMIEEVTSDELALMANVKAILVDEEWFQVYDNNNKFTEKYVASGDYWNYFYHTWKTISHSPFMNAVVFATSAATIAPPANLTVVVTGKDTSDEATVFTLEVDDETAALTGGDVRFLQTQDLTSKGIAVHPFGAVIVPASQNTNNAIKLVADCMGKTYTATTNIQMSGASTTDVGAEFTLNPSA